MVFVLFVVLAILGFLWMSRSYQRGQEQMRDLANGAADQRRADDGKDYGQGGGDSIGSFWPRS